MKKKGLTMTTLEKIRGQIQAKFAIRRRDFMDNESFSAMGISSMQMAHFLNDIGERYAITIDLQEIDFFDIDSPLKLANLIDRSAV